MTARHTVRESLPRSHVFITLAYGRATRTFATRSGFVAVAAIATPLLLLWFIGSTFFFVFHDNFVTALMLRERDMQYGYEDRIATLRNELNRQTTRQLVSQRAIETKIDELARRESDLQGRSHVISRLASDAANLSNGAETRPLSSAQPIAFGTGSTLSYAPADAPKPRPEPMTDHPVGSADMNSRSGVADRVSLLSTSLDDVDHAQQGQIAELDTRIRKTVGHYRDALAGAGVSESRLFTDHGGAGGPFVPLMQSDDGSAFSRAATSVQLSLSQAMQLGNAIKHVPFSRPLKGDPEITSPFGPRVDPFLGRPALHTGVDLSEDLGTDVEATAPGKVTVAGPVSGYGTMVEIDHGAGLITRYAHLSETRVSVGQIVKRGDTIGLVGATGRATGPHLHYETRIDGDPVDPLHFMAAGERLRVAQGGHL